MLLDHVQLLPHSSGTDIPASIPALLQAAITPLTGPRCTPIRSFNSARLSAAGSFGRYDENRAIKDAKSAA